MSGNAKELIEALEKEMIKVLESGCYGYLEELSKAYQRIKSVNQ